MSPAPLPTFERPPLRETLLGVQFHPEPGLRVQQLGAFLQDLGPEWSAHGERKGLGQIQEAFGDEALRSPTEIQWPFKIEPGMRLLAARRDGTRVLQVENGWLVFNWNRQTQPYPTYTALKPEFDRHLAAFVRVVEDAGGSFRPNLWEVTYINIIPRGELWGGPADWGRILPSLFHIQPGSLGAPLTGTGRWTFRLPDSDGRLHVSYEHGLVEVSARQESFVLRLTARGPLADPGGLDAGLELGHASIVQAFAALLSQEAKQHWGYKDD